MVILPKRIGTDTDAGIDVDAADAGLAAQFEGAHERGVQDADARVIEQGL